MILCKIFNRNVSYEDLQGIQLYVTLELGNQRYRTYTKYCLKDTIWDEMFIFEDNADGQLKITLYDEEKFMFDKTIATEVIDITSIKAIVKINKLGINIEVSPVTLYSNEENEKLNQSITSKDQTILSLKNVISRLRIKKTELKKSKKKIEDRLCYVLKETETYVSKIF